MELDALQGFLPGQHEIEGYGKGGFRFGGMSHQGSILALPSGIHAWRAAGPEDITEASLSLVFAEPEGEIEHFLLGMGEAFFAPSKGLKERFFQAHIRLEPMATGAAARTYSILLGEKRKVAAALLAVS